MFMILEKSFSNTAEMTHQKEPREMYPCTNILEQQQLYGV